MAGKTRRVVLGSLAAAGALMIGWSVLPPRQRLQTAGPLPTSPGQTALNGWVKVAADGSVIVMMSKSEMGQGVLTSLSMLLADEMDADWSRVRTETSPIDKIYNNIATLVDGLPFHPDSQGLVKQFAGWMTAKTMREVGVMMTGGSSSIKDLWLPMRQAGAAARQMLVSVAGSQWGVSAAECRTEAGRVSHPSGKSAGYGDLAAKAGLLSLPSNLVLKDPKEFKLIGKPLLRIDGAAKSDGSAVFGIDVTPEGMLYASVLMCPTLGGRVATMDDGAASKMNGVHRVVRVDGHRGGTAGVAVIADNLFQAKKALDQIKVQWNHGAAASANSDAMMAQMAKLLDSESGFGYYETGDVDGAMKKAARTLAAEYRAPWLAHQTMEPMNCTVLFKDGKATVWVSTQVPGLARAAAADALGIDADRVDVRVQMLGSGFGRRLDSDFVGQAAAIARQMPGRPVQTIWSREQDTAHDFYRPACVSRWQAGLDGKGHVQALRNLSVGQSVVHQAVRRNFGAPAGGPDRTTSDGAFDQPYEWLNARIAHHVIDLPVPIGFWRSVGHSHQAFFKESFIDECAASAGADPVEYRAALLARHPRHLAVLRRAAQLAGWGTPLPNRADGTEQARGIALHQSFGSIVAQVAEVSLGADNGIRVHRVVCVIDCGVAVNPNIIVQQMEGGIVFGLSAALYGQIDIVNGQVRQSSFHDLPVLRLADCPHIVTDIIASSEHPEGVGEPGVPPIAPAVANALFALSGQRLRSLPLKLA